MNKSRRQEFITIIFLVVITLLALGIFKPSQKAVYVPDENSIVIEGSAVDHFQNSSEASGASR